MSRGSPSRNENRSHRLLLKELLDRCKSENDFEMDTTASLIMVQDVLNSMNSISDDIPVEESNTASDLLLESQILRTSGEMVGNALSKCTDSEFNDDEYYNAIMNIIGQDLDWDKLTPYFHQSARYFKGTVSMFPAFDTKAVLETVKKERKKIKDTSNQQEVSLKVEPVVINESVEHRPILNDIMNRLLQVFKKNKNKPLPYYKVVIHPRNFQHSFDNIIQLSFLFRDGYLVFGIGDDGLPTVAVVNEALRADEAVEMQFVSSFSVAMWETMIDKYKIKEPMLDIDRSKFFKDTPKRLE